MTGLKTLGNSIWSAILVPLDNARRGKAANLARRPPNASLRDPGRAQVAVDLHCCGKSFPKAYIGRRNRHLAED